MKKNLGLLLAIIIATVILVVVFLRYKTQQPNYWGALDSTQINTTPVVQDRTSAQPEPQKPVTPTSKSKTVALTEKNTNSTTTVSKGDIISLTLYDANDGEYHFEGPLLYDTTIIKLKNHIQTPPVLIPDSHGDLPIGTSGTETWNFEAIKSGTTIIKIDIVRGSYEESRENRFTGTVIVK